MGRKEKGFGLGFLKIISAVSFPFFLLPLQVMQQFSQNSAISKTQLCNQTGVLLATASGNVKL